MSETIGHSADIENCLILGGKPHTCGLIAESLDVEFHKKRKSTFIKINYVPEIILIPYLLIITLMFPANVIVSML